MGSCINSACTPITLAMGQTSVGALAVDAANVYWTNEPSPANTGSVESCAIGGCGLSPTTVAPNQTTPLGLSLGIPGIQWGPLGTATNIYWTNFAPSSGGSVSTCAIGSCNPSVLVPNLTYPHNVVADTTNIYWDMGATSAESVSLCPWANCAAGTVPLQSGDGNLVAIAIDATNVYWADNIAGNISVASIQAPHNARTLVAMQQGVFDIAVDATNIYWTNHNNGIVSSCSKTTCGTPTVLGMTGDAEGIAIDTTTVYWASPANNTIFACAIGGCGMTPTPVAANQANASVIAVDGTSIYWAGGGGAGNAYIRQMTKP